MIQVRLATADDAPMIRFLAHMECKEEGVEQLYNDGYLSDTMDTYLDTDIGFTVCAFDDAMMVGFTVYEYKNFVGNIAVHELGLYVMPSHRGLKIGRMLIEAAEAHVAASGRAAFITIGARYGLNHERLMEFYGRMGYMPFQILFMKGVDR